MPHNELIPYVPDEGSKPLGFVFDGETLWVTQEQIAEMFQVTVQNVSQHITNIYQSGDLEQSTTLKKSFRPVENGQRHRINFYNLDVVINVGYKVNSKKATAFRKWSTAVLRDKLLGNNTTDTISADEQRVMIADRVAVENNELVTTGRELGVVDDVAFLNAGYQGMYKRKMPEIKKMKGLTNERLLDRAGVTELAANEFRITQTSDKLRKLKEEDGILVGHGVALTIHHDVGSTVRSAIEEIGGTMPEDHPLEPDHISDVRKRVLTAKVKPKSPDSIAE